MKVPQALNCVKRLALTIIALFLDVVRHQRVRLGLGALSGVLYFTGFCGFDQYYLSWICLLPILIALCDPALNAKHGVLTYPQVFVISWFFGLITHMGGYPWIIGLLLDFAHVPLPVAFLGYVLLCICQGTLLAVWGLLLFHFVVKRKLPVVWGAPIAMTVAELICPLLFPSYLANSQYRQLVVIQSLDLWGPLGLTFLLTLSSAAIFTWWQHRPHWQPAIRPLLLLFSTLIATLIYGTFALHKTRTEMALVKKEIKVGLVQTNMGIYEKARNPQEGLRRHREQSVALQEQGADLIIWPESGYNYIIPEKSTHLKQLVMGNKLHTPLIFGGLRIENGTSERKLFNTAVLLDKNGKRLGSYDKTYLLAFGEYLPLGNLFPFIYKLSPATAHFTPGNHTEPLVLDGIRYGMLICYEDLLPRFVRTVMAHNPDVLVNITNDAWFGKTREPLIHLALASFRAVEYRRYLVRATNTGISAVISPLGQILSPTAVFERASVLETIKPMQGTTFYGRHGDWIGWLCLFVLVIWEWRWHRQPHPRSV